MKSKLILLISGMLFVILASFVYAIIVWGDGTLTEFEISATRPSCDYETFVWRWWEGGEIKENSSLNDCFRPDGWPSTTCCPEPNECDLSITTPPYSCTGESTPEVCSDYNLERYGNINLTKNQCLGFNINVSKRSMELFTGIPGFCDHYKISDVREGKSCWKFVLDCRCVWDDDENLCGQQASYSNWTCVGDTSITLENCTVTTTQKTDDCEETGYMFYSWQAFWTGDETDKPDWCVDNERKIRCSAKLTFFTIASFIAAIVLIILVYIWIKKGRAKKKTKKRRR